MFDQINRYTVFLCLFILIIPQPTGDCISNNTHTKRILLLHSFHYVNLTNGGLPEVYAREIGLEMERERIPDVVTVESPKSRSFNRLLKKYRCDWLVDLHDIGREYKPEEDDLPHYLDMGVGPRTADVGAVGKYYWKIHEFVKSNNYRVIAMEIGGNPRNIVVELYPWIPKKTSIDFLTGLLKFLKDGDI